MAVITYKESTLNNAADIVKYANRDCFYLRVKRTGKRYSMVSLKTEDLEVARRNSIESYMKIMSEEPKRRVNKLSFAKACDEFLKYKYLQAKRKQITERSAGSYEQRIYQRIIPFAKFMSVETLADITDKSFTSYSDYFLDVKTKGKWKSATEGLTPSTINSDISTLKELLKYLINENKLQSFNLDLIKRAKDRTNYREDSNPAFLPDEWQKMNDVLYTWDKDLPRRFNRTSPIDDECDVWKRRWFINYIRFQFQSGTRPHESAKIRIGDCRNATRTVNGEKKFYGFVYIRPDTKRGKRELVMNGYALQKVLSHLKKGIKLRNKQIEYQNKRIKEDFSNRDINWLSRRYSEMDISTREIPLLEDVKPDDLLLMNPFCTGKRLRFMYHSEHIRKWWNQILEICNFDKRYTLYSLRSTHITFNLLQDRPIKKIADNCGTSQAEIERTYQRINNILNLEDLGFFYDKKYKNKEDELVIEPLMKLK
tara:strand:- start:836 stop:2281 length:1446 start_codon:yes stop_codon:yes gene_type:complete